MDEFSGGVLASDAPTSSGTPKPKKKRKASKRFKVTRFDKDLVKLIHAGTVDLKEICVRLGVDYDQARQRALWLAEKKFLVTDPSHPDVFRLGLEGYNQFASTVKTKTRKAPFLPQPPTPAPSPALETPESDVIPKAQNAVDLADLLRRGAPTTPFASRDSAPSASSAPSFSSSLPPVTQKDAGKNPLCELCRAPFKLSVKNMDGAKYAHCFCGAAYHKDCYHALVEGGGRCARCGRKLSLILDRHSEEALKSVKDLFD